MPRSRPPYASEFRRQIVDLARSGRKREELSREFEPSAQAIRNWVRQADREQGIGPDGLTRVGREDLQRLRREKKQLRKEREILKTPAAWFANEVGIIPSGSSGS